MQVHRLVADDHAASPVVGVALLIAITTILAAVVGAFVLSAGQEASSQTPRATFSFAYSEVDANPGAGSDDWGQLRIAHESGEAVDHEELYVRGVGFNGSQGACAHAQDWARTGHTCSPPGVGTNMQDYTAEEIHMAKAGQWPAGRTSGDESHVVRGDVLYLYVSSDYEVSVVWETREGDWSATLSEDDGPDA